jgi:hypothetical protein
MSYSFPCPDHPSLDGFNYVRASFDLAINFTRFPPLLAQNLPSSASRLDFTRQRRIDMEIKPQAVVIPKETDHLEKGKYGPIFPKTPACYGFTIIANQTPLSALGTLRQAAPMNR